MLVARGVWGGCSGSRSVLWVRAARGSDGSCRAVPRPVLRGWHPESSPCPTEPRSPLVTSSPSPLLGWQQRLGCLPGAACSKVNHFLRAAASPVVCFASRGRFSCSFQPLALEQEIFFPGRLRLLRCSLS